ADYRTRDKNACHRALARRIESRRGRRYRPPLLTDYLDYPEAALFFFLSFSEPRRIIRPSEPNGCVEISRRGAARYRAVTSLRLPAYVGFRSPPVYEADPYRVLF